MMENAALITAFTSLFVIIDAPGLTPLFIALTQGMTKAHRLRVGLRACITAGVLMLVFLVLGERVLTFIGITMPAFRIAGGILLFLTALDMLFERRRTRRESNAEEGAAEHRDDPSVSPLAIPLIVGPGTITTIILLASQTTGIGDYIAIAIILALNLFIVFAFFLAAPAIERMLGRVGINVVTRVLGMLLAALAIQFILDGLSTSGIGF
ncbi:MAG: NAAT family transporter [Rhodobacterales bacterium]|nr:NAAT family transporter [Rhodobacterales bacterium]